MLKLCIYIIYSAINIYSTVQIVYKYFKTYVFIITFITEAYHNLISNVTSLSCNTNIYIALIASASFPVFFIFPKANIVTICQNKFINLFYFHKVRNRRMHSFTTQSTHMLRRACRVCLTVFECVCVRVKH